jgi:hypothetical protein
MTATNSLQSTVDEMLLDAGETDPNLRAALLSLGALASLPVPEPRPELAALLSAQTVPLARHRLRRTRRTAAVGLAVIAGMGLGVTGVAATASAPKVHASPSIQQLMQDWVPAWTIAGTLASGEAASDLTGAAPSESGVETAPAPADPGQSDPGPAGPGQTDSEPAGHRTAGHGATGPDSKRPANAEPGTPGWNDKHHAAHRGPGSSGAEGAAGSSPAADDDATRNTSGNGAGVAQDRTAPLVPPRTPGGIPADVPAMTGKLITGAPAAVGEAALPGPFANERTGAGNAGPGSIWLKKFNR